jgi:hypothetical protein
VVENLDFSVMDICYLFSCMITLKLSYDFFLPLLLSTTFRDRLLKIGGPNNPPTESNFCRRANDFGWLAVAAEEKAKSYVVTPIFTL